MALYCPNCGIELPDGVAFCDACGTRLNSAPSGAGGHVGVGPPAPGSGAYGPSYGGAPMGSVACPVCGAAALPGEAFCDNCGASLTGPAYPAHPASAPATTGAYPPTHMPYPAVGVRTASLVVLSPPPPATLQVPDRAELIVGRSDPQSNSYPDVDLGPYGGLELGVSRRHFRLTRNGDQFYIEDLSSMNGTVVNGQRIPPHTLHPLRPGDRIVLGKMELGFELS